MDSKDLSQLAERLSRREVSLEEFLRELARPKTADLEEVQLDLDRGRRCGYPEVVYGEGKSLAALEKTLARMVEEKIDALVTRLAPELAAELQKKFPAARLQSGRPHFAPADLAPSPLGPSVWSRGDCHGWHLGFAGGGGSS